MGGHTRRLPDLFIVLATQNPLEQSGTYPLPEAQLDRFLFQVLLGYPSIEEEVEIARRARQATEGHVEEAVRHVLEPPQILEMRQRLQFVFIEPTVERYAVELVAATRDPGRWRPEWKDCVVAGASPRGSIALLRAAMARAWLAERDYVVPEDVIELAPDVLRHRLVLSFSAAAEGLDAATLVAGLIEAVPVP